MQGDISIPFLSINTRYKIEIQVDITPSTQEIHMEKTCKMQGKNRKEKKKFFIQLKSWAN